MTTLFSVVVVLLLVLIFGTRPGETCYPISMLWHWLCLTHSDQRDQFGIVHNNILHNPTGYWVWLMNGLTLNEVPTIIVQYYYPPQTKLRKGNVFTPVCDSVHSTHAQRPGRHPRTRHQADTPQLGRHPPDQTNISRTRQTPPNQADTPPKTATAADDTNPTGMHSCF